MKDIKELPNEVIKIYTLINDLDVPEDFAYDTSDMLSKFDGHTNKTWQETEQYKQWCNDPNRMLEAWRNCSTHIIQLLENSKEP
jgi:hypothetical protein